MATSAEVDVMSPSNTTESGPNQPSQPSGRLQMPMWVVKAWHGQRGPWSIWRTLRTLVLIPAIASVSYTYGFTALAWPMPLKLVGVIALIVGVGSLFLFFRAIVSIFIRFGIGRLLLIAIVGYTITVVFVSLTVPSGEQGATHWIVTAGDVVGDLWRGTERSLSTLWHMPDTLLFATTGHRDPAQIPGVMWPNGTPPTPIVISADNLTTVSELESIVAERPTATTSEATPMPFNIGDRVQIVGTDGAILRARKEPNTSAQVVARFPPDTLLEIVAGPEHADGHDWWRVRSTNGEGWCAAEFLAALP